MKRQRGRNRNNNNRTNNNHNRSLDSNGPDVKVRGTASTIYEKYTTLARDAASSGNRVKAENYRQHAEHYLRLMNEQEAAKQEAREKAEAERAARIAAGEDVEEVDNRRNSRGRNNNNRRRQETTDDKTDGETQDNTPEGLETVNPEESEKPKVKLKKKARVSDDSDEATAEEASESDEKPKRRRRAPARKPASDEVEAAE